MASSADRHGSPASGRCAGCARFGRSTGFRRHNADADFITADLGPDRTTQARLPGDRDVRRGDLPPVRRGRDIASGRACRRSRARADILIQRRSDSPWAHRLDVPEPRFIALHTIAHLLIRRLAFASGYSSASLQERIYANSDRPDRTAGHLDLHRRWRRSGNTWRSGATRCSPTSSFHCWSRLWTMRTFVQTTRSASRATGKARRSSTCRHATAAPSSARRRARRPTASWTVSWSSAAARYRDFLTRCSVKFVRRARCREEAPGLEQVA